MNVPSGLLTAILPCNDLDASERFYNRLGFARPHTERPVRGAPDTYRMLSNGKGGHLHLAALACFTQWAMAVPLARGNSLSDRGPRCDGPYPWQMANSSLGRRKKGDMGECLR